MTYGFIGTGNMGGALARAAAKSVEHRRDLVFANRSREKAEALANELGANLADNETVARQCDYILLGVKPQLMGEVLGALSPIFKERTTDFVLISMAAGLTVQQLQEMAGGKYPVIRILPNTAVAVGEGVTLWCAGKEVSEGQKAGFLSLLSASGLLEELPEHLIDAGCAVAGCGGAFACLFMEALSDGGVLCGLPRDKALRYAAQMLRGTAALALETGEHPAKMKDAICSPGGSTIAGVRALEENGFRSAVTEAVIAAYRRTVELGK